MRNGVDILQLIEIGIYLALLIGRTIHLRTTQGIRPFVLGIGKSDFPEVLEILFFAGFVVWLMEAALYAFHAPVRIFPPPLDSLLLDSILWKGIGVTSLLAGCLLFAWALVSFGASWRVGIDTQTPGKLITNGVFAFSRNPIFLSIDLLFIGTFLIQGTVFFLAAAVLVVLGMPYQILQEEKHLKKRYGEEYRMYNEKTARYFGR